MIKKILTIALAVFTINTYAQITVTDNDVLSIGDVMYLAETNSVNSSINLGGVGANQNWDFSSLQVMNVETSQCINPNGTPHHLYYPNANLCIEENGDFLYFNKNSTKVEFLGEGDSVFQQPVVVLPLPLTYGSTYTDGPIMMLDSVIGGPVVNLMLASQGITAAMISGGTAHTADTINIKVDFLTDFDVDAWGTMTIPMGSFDCLRLKMKRTSNSQILVFCSDTITGSGSGWYPLQVPDIEQEITYQWWSNNVNTKFALAELQVDSIGNINGNVRFLHNSASTTEDIELALMKIYPIPTAYKVNIEANSTNLTTYKMYDILGNLVLEKTFTKNTQLDLSQMAKGSYLLNITTERGSVRKKIIVE